MLPNGDFVRGRLPLAGRVYRALPAAGMGRAFGPFERIGKILEQDPAIARGAGHHSVIQVPGRDEWYIVYHRRPLDETGSRSGDRRTMLQCPQPP